MLHTLRSRLTEEKGFTLIELLVVILIIGILAAIALPSFLGQRGKAQDSEAKTAARTAATAQEAFFTDGRTYATGAAGVTALREIEPALNDGTAAGANFTAVAPSPTGGAGAAATNSYRVSVVSSTGNTFQVNRLANGRTTRTCVVPAGRPRQGCPTSGNW